MTPFEAYKDYLTLKQHFTPNSSYDYHKYNGKTNVKISSFEKRTDKIFFEKLSRHTDLHQFLLANFAHNEKAYIKDLAFSDDAVKIYKEWLKTQETLSYVYKQDLSKLESSFDSNFFCVNHQHPVLLKKYLGKDIHLETICILLEISKAIKYWNRELQYDIVWEVNSNKIIKYTPFIIYDKAKFKKITIDFYT